ncbi:DUF4435 domain-containing protein [Spirulina sp. CCNP1310]|uniref:DUF4435 domain-containing protein n=1 Tax=Spirulina sp. CCNP1310 TaxID=3110249 RepID=UPI002B1F90B9|nr:DUF4435 domain-containing protein [Spirulina sp. CCNP1310]MEA5418850.1 DUF4435 domain-containing protein [Spirulina sp. CCNP1310]
MRENLTADREANAIRMKRSTFAGVFLLVEGSTDKVFYERFVKKDCCNVIVISGKPSSKLKSISVLSILEKQQFQGVLAIVDADFDHLESSVPNIPNLVRTDTHDLETMLLQSLALDKVIAELGSEEKIAKFRDIRTALLDAGMPIGYLLWISKLDELNLTFNNLEFGKFIDKKTLTLDESELIQHIKNKSQAFTLKNEDLQKRIQEQRDESHDPWQVCCGHHLVEILSLGLQKAIGSMEAKKVEADALERELRLAYESSYFCQTQIYALIRRWESDNPPFKVLRGEQDKD